MNTGSLVPVSVSLLKPTVLQLVKKFPVFCVSRLFIAILTTAPVVPLLSQIYLVVVLPAYFFGIHFNIMQLCLPIGLFPYGFHPKPCMKFSSVPYVPHSPPISFSMLGTLRLTVFFKPQLQSVLCIYCETPALYLLRHSAFSH